MIRLFLWRLFCGLVGLGAIVGIVTALFIDTATKSGPGCPAPVPAEWLGYCADFDVR